jgi:PPOX class probable F420-dependent enzyme
MTVELTSEDREILTGQNFAHFATVNGDGSPHVSPVWIDVDDDGNVLVNSAVGRRKDRNIRRDPRVALSISPANDPYRWLAVEGEVTSIETGDEAEAHISALSQRYDGTDYEYVPGQVRVIYRIGPVRIARSR